MNRNLAGPGTGHLYISLAIGSGALLRLQRYRHPVSYVGILSVQVGQPSGALGRHFLQSGAARHSRKDQCPVNFRKPELTIQRLTAEGGQGAVTLRALRKRYASVTVTDGNGSKRKKNNDVAIVSQSVAGSHAGL